MAGPGRDDDRGGWSGRSSVLYGEVRRREEAGQEVTHFNGQLYIQEVQEKKPANVDQYGKVIAPATERISTSLIEVKVSGDTQDDIMAQLQSHLQTAVQLRAVNTSQKT